MSGLATVYVDWSVSPQRVREAVATLAIPDAVSGIVVDGSATTNAFDDYRIAVELTGDFTRGDGELLARRYAVELGTVLGVPALCLADLLVQKRPAS